MKKSKVLVMTLCAVLLVATTVLGTLAYLTDRESVTNTFTVGQVDITVDEADVNVNGQPTKNGAVVEIKDVKDSELLTYERWQPTTGDTEQKYHLIPGQTYIKDPTMTVVKGSEEAYVRMMVTVTFNEALTDEQLATDLDGIFTGYDAANWPRHDKTVADDKMSITYEYRYKTTVNTKDASANMPLEPLFTRIAIPGAMDNETIAVLGGMTITVTGHAIQAATFDTADDAWKAFGDQMNANP